MARGLKLASAGALGLLVPSLRNPVYSAIIRGAFDRAWERDYVVLLAEDIGAASAQQAYERLVEQGRIDGLLIASARPGSPLFDHLVDDPIPCVFVNRRHLGSGRNAAMREEDAGRLAAEHLLGLGHTRLAHISGPTELDTARRRADGFASAVRAAGHRCSVVAAPFDERGGLAAMRSCSHRRTPPDRRVRLEHQPGRRRASPASAWPAARSRPTSRWSATTTTRCASASRCR